MTRDEIMKMARQAGAHNLANVPEFTDFLTRFAELVAAAEREACAKVCEVRSEGWNQARTKDDYQMCALGAKNEARALAAAIRARGER
jgi:hypothetical protein